MSFEVQVSLAIGFLLALTGVSVLVRLSSVEQKRSALQCEIRDQEEKLVHWLQEVRFKDFHGEVQEVFRAEYSRDIDRQNAVVGWLLRSGEALATNPKTDAGRSRKFAEEAVRIVERTRAWETLSCSSPTQFLLVKPVLWAQIHGLVDRNGESLEFVGLMARMIGGERPTTRSKK